MSEIRLILASVVADDFQGSVTTLDFPSFVPLRVLPVRGTIVKTSVTYGFENRTTRLDIVKKS